MQPVIYRIAVPLLAALVTIGGNANAGRLKYGPKGIQGSTTAQDRKPPSGKDDEKPFKDLIKDKVAVQGLFTFYRDTLDNSVLMAIKPDQFGPIFLCGETRVAGDGSYTDNASMGETYPFYFKRVGKTIMMMEKNLRFRVDSTSSLRKALANAISDGLVASTKVMSKPDDSNKAVLIDASAIFISDAENLGFFLGQQGQTGINFDRSNSYFDVIKSFPQNSEIDVRLHFRSNKPQDGSTFQNSYSFYHGLHYSLSSLPQTDYVPRLADDRVGHFVTMFEDYSTNDQPTPYKYYVERWNLKKKNPDARISEPVEPIVYWVSNTVPPEYRDAFAEGIEFWNPSFEKIGFRNAVVAKQMPDTATWDPADVRYNTVNWIIQPGGGYAVGPDRTNPFTGQIYDADIRVSADFIRFMYNTSSNFIRPIAFDGKADDPTDPGDLLERARRDPHFCSYGEEGAADAGFGLAYLEATGDYINKDSLTKEYVHAYIVELVAHEVGHTLGFRHNFKASTIYTLEQLSDREFTKKNGTIGTVMDYSGPNIADHGKTQGEFYASTPGPCDDWIVEYAYSDFGAKTSEEELPKLQEIASRSGETGLRYLTDEDTFGWGTKAIDPLANLHDLGSDPLKYAEHKVNLTRQLWSESIKKFDVPGNSYRKLFQVFQSGWRSFNEGALTASKYVGGIYQSRSHIGDKDAAMPFEVVAAADQRRAIEFLKTNLFAANAYDLPTNLLNKLQPERMPDFDGAYYNVPSLDYPMHQIVANFQYLAISRLYSPQVTGRLVNNLEKFKPGEEKFTMFDMFTDLRKAIWGEAFTPANVNDYRRPLQLIHLQRLIDIYLSAPGVYPFDARTLAANDLDLIEQAASKAATAGVDGMSQAHFKEVVRQIQAAKRAPKSYSDQ